MALQFNSNALVGSYEPVTVAPNDYQDFMEKKELEILAGPATPPYLKSDGQLTAIKHDAGKLDWSLIPWDSLEEILKVLEFGKIKYSSWNWSTGEGFKYTRVFNSLVRHLFAWIRGEDKDPESGISHLAHAGCNILFLIYFVKNKDRYPNNDDRYVK